MITLEQLLDSRDRRVQHQKELLSAFPGCSLICLTVQLPGPVKRSYESLVIGGAGLGALLNIFGSILRHVHVRDLETGYEAYLLVPLPAIEVKKRCCTIEDTHPLGRLMDIDVLPGSFGDVPGSFGVMPGSFGVMPGSFCDVPGSCGVMPGSDRASEGSADITPLSRADIGLEPRRCLLCGNEARFCMRAHTHSTADLLKKISEMVDSYAKS